MESKKKRKKKKSIIIIISIIILWIAIVSLCNFINNQIKNKAKALNGKFYYDENTQYEFDGNGKGYLYIENSKYEYKYEIVGKTLKIDFADDKIIDAKYSYKLENTTLTLIGTEGTIGGKYVLEKIE